jgi:hypothetical protein
VVAKAPQSLSKTEREARLKTLEEANSNPSTSKAVRLKALLATYEEPVIAMKAELLKFVPSTDAKVIDRAQLDYDPEDSLMGFVTATEEDGMISLSVGGIRTLAMLIDALLIVQHGFRSTHWLISYEVYVRQAYLARQWAASPYEAANLTSDSLDKKFLDKSINLHEDALLFTLAHEAAHLVKKHSVKKESGESELDFTRRVQKQEAAADEYALEVYRRRKIPPASLVGVLTFLLTVYEPRTGDLASAIHPPDRVRLVNLLRESLKLIRSNPKGTQQELAFFETNARESIKTLSNDALYSQLLRDRDAFPVPTLEQLKYEIP